MTGLSVNILTDRLDAVALREFVPVTSRSLLEGILTVKRIDLFGSAGGISGEDRDTVTDEGAVVRVSLVVLVLTLESRVSGGLSRARRERRERADMGGRKSRGR